MHSLVSKTRQRGKLLTDHLNAGGRADDAFPFPEEWETGSHFVNVRMHTGIMRVVLRHAGFMGLGIGLGVWIGLTPHDSWWIFRALIYSIGAFELHYFTHDEDSVREMILGGYYFLPVMIVTGLAVQWIPLCEGSGWDQHAKSPAAGFPAGVTSPLL